MSNKSTEKSKNNRDVVLRFRVTQTEYEVIEMRAGKTNHKSLSSFLRRMALYGYIVNYDNQDIKKLTKSLVNIQTNINQIAVRANSTNRVYAEDIEYIEEVTNEIWQSLKSVQLNLQSLQQ